MVSNRVPLERMLRLVTANTARVLKLAGKGRLEEGCDADVVVLRKGSLEIREVVARGRRMVIGGQVVAREHFLKDSYRTVSLIGAKQPGARQPGDR